MQQSVHQGVPVGRDVQAALRVVPLRDVAAVDADYPMSKFASSADMRYEMLAEIAALRVTRAELLAALRDLIGWVPSKPAWHTDAPSMAVERARAAITKAGSAA